MGTRMVSKGLRARVHRSLQTHPLGPALRMQPKSSPSSSSSLALCWNEHEFSKGEPAARAREDGPEYLMHRFNELAERFQQQASTQKQYVSDISHELRAPISRIRVLLDRARQCPQEIYTYLSRIEENVLRMQALTKRLLDFSCVEHIEGEFSKEPCDLGELISKVVEDARIEAEAHGCSIEHSLILSCRVYANYELLFRAVENVVRNSVQYTKENSSISVVLSCPSSKVAQILVEDEGPGISQEELKEVFKPFYRAAHARANKTSGVGLGLAISKRAVTLHGGNINACNRSDGRGLRVTIQIPLSQSSQISQK